MLTQDEQRRRETALNLNIDALTALPQEFTAIRFANSRFGYERGEWRALQRNSGMLRGLEHLGRVKILATDGLQAWFALPQSQVPLHEDMMAQPRTAANVFLGHLAAFDGKIEPLYSAGTKTSKTPARKISARMQLLNSL